MVRSHWGVFLFLLLLLQILPVGCIRFLLYQPLHLAYGLVFMPPILRLLELGFFPEGAVWNDFIFDVITRQCPSCSKAIKRDAEQCPYCKNNFYLQEIATQMSQQREIVSTQLKKMKNGGHRKCPACGDYAVDKAVIEGGAWGDWCSHCNMSLQLMKAQSIDIDTVNTHDENFTNFNIDEEIKKFETHYLKLCEQTLCPACGKPGIYGAVIEGGGWGDWCPHCKMSLQQMKAQGVC
jgi:hypothetical protein